MITALAFSPDGTHLVTASGDGTARLWNLSASDKLASAVVLRGDGAGITALAFSPDGTRLATAGSDGTARLWELPLDRLSQTACRMAGRNLTWVEWQQYFSQQEYRTICLELPVHPSVIARLFVQATELARQGKIADALAVYKEAQQRYPSFEMSPTALNSLCWSGSIAGQAAAALDACERAVKLAPEDGDIRNSRGIARALTGNTAGAIEDFEIFIAIAQQQGDREGLIAERQSWITTLRAGRNPFDDATLKALQDE